MNEKTEENQKKEVYHVVETTVGRVLLSEILPSRLSFDLINRPMTKKIISKLINTCYRRTNLKECAIFADRLKNMGFHYATRSGISIGIDDLLVPEVKIEIINAAEEEVKEIENQYASGLVTKGELYNKKVDIGRMQVILLRKK